MQREVTVKLNLNADTGGARQALAQAAGATGQLTAAERAYQEQLKRRPQALAASDPGGIGFLSAMQGARPGDAYARQMFDRLQAGKTLPLAERPGSLESKLQEAARQGQIRQLADVRQVIDAHFAAAPSQRQSQTQGAPVAAAPTRTPGELSYLADVQAEAQRRIDRERRLRGRAEGDVSAGPRPERGFLAEEARAIVERAKANAGYYGDQQGGPPPGGLFSRGGLTGLLLRGGAVGVAGALVSNTLQRGAGVANTLNRDDLTSQQRTEGVLRNLPLIGGLIGSFIDLRKALDGTTESVRRMGRDLALFQADTQAAGRAERRVAQVRQEYRQAAFGVQAQAATPYFAPGGFARTTLEEQFAYRQERQLDAARLALRQAQAQRAGLAAEFAGAERDVRRQQPRAGIAAGSAGRSYQQALAFHEGLLGAGSPFTTSAAARGRQVAEGAGRAGGSAAEARRLTARAGGNVQVAHFRALTQAARDQAEAERELANLADRVNHAREAGLRLAQAESAERRAQIELQRAELANLQQREQTAQSQARRVGRMTAVEFMEAQRAAQFVRQAGVDFVPREVRERARGLIPEELENLEERLGARRIREAGLGARGLGREFRDNLPDVRQQVDRLQAQVTMNVQLDEETLARRIAELLGPYVRRVETEASRRFQLDQERQRTNLLIQQAQQ